MIEDGEYNYHYFVYFNYDDSTSTDVSNEQ